MLLCRTSELFNTLTVLQKILLLSIHLLPLISMVYCITAAARPPPTTTAAIVTTTTNIAAATTTTTILLLLLLFLLLPPPPPVIYIYLKYDSEQL